MTPRTPKRADADVDTVVPAEGPMAPLQQQARALGDPTRYELFRYLVEAAGPVGVADLTDHVGLNHNAVRQHLAKLVDAGLVREHTSSPIGRGRPRLVYEVDPGVDSRWGVQGPYERLSLWLAEMIRTGDSPLEIGERVGRERHGPRRSVEDPVAVLVEEMAREGFDATVHRQGSDVTLTLDTCPFATTALADPDTICALHLGLARGIAEDLDGLVVDSLEPKDPRHAGCHLRCHVEPATA